MVCVKRKIKARPVQVYQMCQLKKMPLQTAW